MHRNRFCALLSLDVMASGSRSISFFFFNDTATTEIYTLSLHDALPISHAQRSGLPARWPKWHEQRPEHRPGRQRPQHRSEEHTSELQSPCNLVCRLLLEKKKPSTIHYPTRSPSTHERVAAAASFWCRLP